MDPDHPYYDVIRNDPRYKDGPTDEEFPTCESLKLTIGTFLFTCCLRKILPSSPLTYGLVFIFDIISVLLKTIKALSSCGHGLKVHRVAMAAFWRTFHTIMMEKLAQAVEGGG